MNTKCTDFQDESKSVKGISIVMKLREMLRSVFCNVKVLPNVLLENVY